MKISNQISALYRQQPRTPEIQDKIAVLEAERLLARKRPGWYRGKVVTYFKGRGSTSDALRAMALVLRLEKIGWASIYKMQSGDIYMVGILLVGDDHAYLIPDGFAEGYSGEGPRGLEQARAMLRNKGVPSRDSILDEKQFETLFSKCNGKEA